MPERFLSVHDLPALVDFVEEAMEYLPESMRENYEDFLEELETGSDIPLSSKADTVKRLAAEVWPMKKTFKNFVQQEGAPLEFEAVVVAVRPTTALLLKRLQNKTQLTSLDQIMRAPEAAFALHEEEEEEIALVRPEVSFQIWREQKAVLERRVIEAKQELGMIQSQLDRLRQETEASTDQCQEKLSTIETLEDRLYFGGEVLSLEELGIGDRAR